jgi:hypothetical protein
MKFQLFTIILILPLVTKAQSNGQPQDAKEITRIILHEDSLFWNAYNVCDVDKMAAYFTDDLEFYHDKGGFTGSKSLFIESVKKGMCGNPDWRLRREVIEGTVNVFPMNNIGAIISGEHVFYIQESGKSEYLDGYGKFMQLWVFKNNVWKMSRVFSYDHGPAPYINKRKEISVGATTLQRYAGRYQSAQFGVVIITSNGTSLQLEVGQTNAVIYPESEKLFFSKERDLQFEFVTKDSKVVKMIVHEKGNQVDEAQRIP